MKPSSSCYTGRAASSPREALLRVALKQKDEGMTFKRQFASTLPAALMAASLALGAPAAHATLPAVATTHSLTIDTTGAHEQVVLDFTDIAELPPARSVTVIRTASGKPIARIVTETERPRFRYAEVTFHTTTPGHFNAGHDSQVQLLRVLADGTEVSLGVASFAAGSQITVTALIAAGEKVILRTSPVPTEAVLTYTVHHAHYA